MQAHGLGPVLLSATPFACHFPHHTRLLVLAGANRRLPLGLYAAQMVLNLIWQPLFFKVRAPAFALIIVVLHQGRAARITLNTSRAVQDQLCAFG